MEDHYLKNILATRSGWKQVSGRRLLNIGGVVSSKGSLLQAPIPSYLSSLITELTEKFQLYNGAPANHVLINQYFPGEGIMSHQDGPLYCPNVAILSLGSSAIIRFTKKRREEESKEETNIPNNTASTTAHIAPASASVVLESDLEMVSVVLPPRSLFIFKNDAYEEYLHGIDYVGEEILDRSVVNPLEVLKGDARGAVRVMEKEGEAPLVLRREGTRVSLTVRRVLKVHSLGLLRR
jgi:alkylated DNA repair protein alkB family protein 6